MSETSWIPLTNDMALQGLNPAEASITTQGLTTFPSALAEMIGDLTAEIRMSIGSSGRSKLAIDVSLIPHGLKPSAVAILRYRLLARFSNQVSEARTKEYDSALRTLDLVRNGSFVIPDPSGPEAPPPTPSPYFSGRPQRWGPRKQSGIMPRH